MHYKIRKFCVIESKYILALQLACS